jgi:hypothetical protein
VFVPAGKVDSFLSMRSEKSVVTAKRLLTIKRFEIIKYSHLCHSPRVSKSKSELAKGLGKFLTSTR